MDNCVPCRIRFRAVGDVMVHQRQLDCALRPDGSYDFHPQFQQVRECLRDADYTIADLETTIGTGGDVPYSGYPRFHTPDALLDALRDAGVDFLTLANNHILDCGIEVLRSTVDRVEAWGFDFGGAVRIPQEKEKPVIAEIGGIRVGFLCYTDTMNIICERGETETEALARAEASGVITLQKADISADVRRVRAAGAEFIIALPHWGPEYRREPDEETVVLAKKMIASGVDVILGNSPHMVQPVEYLTAETETGERRTGLVAYSLGNFISNQPYRYTDSGIILDFTVSRLREGGFAVENVRVIPTYCWRRDGMIQTLCSKQYLDGAPEGMDDDTFLRLKESYEELRELIDESIPMTA